MCEIKDSRQTSYSIYLSVCIEQQDINMLLLLTLRKYRYHHTKICRRFFSMARSSGFEDTVFDKVGKSVT